MKKKKKVFPDPESNWGPCILPSLAPLLVGAVVVALLLAGKTNANRVSYVIVDERNCYILS